MACLAKVKVYLDKATQTDSSGALSTQSTRHDSIAQSDTAGNSEAHPALERPLARHKTAYVHSEAQASDSTTQDVSLKLSVPSRQRYAQLHFNRPTSFRSSTKRVVSLPEEYANKLGSGEPSQRVVSMPERLKPLSPDSSGSFSSVDISSISVESNIPDLANLLRHRTHAYPHSDLPSTPSPPSSPESIMIIGSKSQVPKTLLRSKCAYSQAYSDNGGWISWANSPPRPIPALHGPLSLPYARCPSGAEGTIIEGEDLTNMIWGLNADEVQHRSHGSANVGQKNQNVQTRPQKSPEMNSSALPEDGPIDLSRLAVSHYQNPNDTSAGQSFSSNQYEIIVNGRTQYSGASRMGLQEAEMRSADWHKGLGLNWQDPIDLPPPKPNFFYQDRDYSTLKASAPPFVPSTAARTLSRVSVEPHFSDFIENGPWLSLGDQVGTSMPYLPTPPSSSSPLWSPYISTPSGTDMMSPRISFQRLPDDKQLLLSQLLSSSQLTKDFAQGLDYCVAEELGSGAKLKLSAFESTSILPSLRTTPPTDSRSPDGPTQDEASRNPTKAPIHLASDSTCDTKIVWHQCDNKNVPVSPERRFRGISQQPRSIPLARLIQRRLSSVAEEDLNALMEENNASTNPTLICTPTVSRTAPKTKGNQPESTASTLQSTRTPSPDTSEFEPRTRQEPSCTIATASTVQAIDLNTKAVVKLPGSGGSSIPFLENVHGEEKENSHLHRQVTTGLPGAVVKGRTRNGRSRRSSSGK